MTCGCRLIECTDPVATTGSSTISLAVLYPAEERERTQSFGSYQIEVALNAAPTGQDLPLIAISHGNNSTPWVFRDLAKHLAKAGFAVALPEHPGNNRRDNSLAGTITNLENRPRHISMVVDTINSDPVLSHHVPAGTVGLIGHSIGAYTGLALAGGQPWSGPHENPDGKPYPVNVTPDRRVRSLVLLNPATFWFLPETLKGIKIPILVFTGQKDTITPPVLTQTVINGVFDPLSVRHTMIPGAGHFSFMSKFPPQMIRPDFPPSQDPAGFDREALQPTLFSDISDFFKQTLH